MLWSSGSPHMNGESVVIVERAVNNPCYHFPNYSSTCLSDRMMAVAAPRLGKAYRQPPLTSNPLEDEVPIEQRKC